MKKFMKSTKTSLAMLLALLLLVGMVPLGAITAGAAEIGDVIFSDDFEDAVAGTSGGWINAQNAYAVVKSGAGKDLTKGLVLNGPKWSRAYKEIKLETNSYYEISFDFYESTSTEAARVNVRRNGGDSIYDLYLSEGLTNTKGMWQSYTGTFYSEDITSVRLMLQLDEDVSDSDKTFDNIVIRKIAKPDQPDQPEEPLFVNGDFETGDFTGWQGQNDEMSVISDNPHGGNYAVKVAGGQWAGVEQKVAVEPNTDYKFTFWARYESGSGEHTMFVMAGGKNLYSETVRVSAADGWKKFEYTINSGEYANLILKFCVSNPRAVYVYDDATFTPLGQVSHDGYLYNGDFENGSKAKWTGGDSFEVVTDAYAGSYALLVEGSAWDNIWQTVPTEANTEYSLVLWAKRAGGDGTIALLYKDKDGIKNVTELYINTTNEWARYTWTFNTGNYAGGRILLMISGGEGSAYVDNVTLMLGKPVSTNGLIYNGDFETGDLSRWDNVGSESAVVDTDKNDGEYALHLKGGQWSAVRQNVKTKKNTEYVLSFYTKRIAGADSMPVWLKNGDNNLTDPDGKDLSVYYSVTAEDGWVKIEHPFNSFEQASIDVLFGIGAVGNEVLIDSIGVEEYKAPLVQPLPLTSYGVVTNRPKTDAANLIVNGGFESTEGAQWNTYTFLNEHLSVVEDKSACDGNKVLYFNSASTENTMQVFWVDVEPDTNYTFSAFVKGAYMSDANVCDATFGVVDPDTGMFMIYDVERGKNSREDYQLVPPCWDNEWHLRSVCFNSGEKTKIGIAVYGYGSQMYLDSIALYKTENGMKYTVPENVDIVSTSIDSQYDACAPEDNVVGNYNLSDEQDTFWSTGYGWQNGFVSIYEDEYGYGNSLQYTGSATAEGVYYIKWIDVKPHTDYTFSVDVLVQESGAGCLTLIDSKPSAPASFVLLTFQQELFGTEWYRFYLDFNSGAFDRIGIAIQDMGGKALIDNIRIFEASAGADVEDEFREKKNGWFKADNGKWTYYQEDVQIKGKWIHDGSAWYYIGADGYMVANKWIKDSKGWCYLTDSGKMATNKWVTDSVGWCYVGADGYCVTNKWVADSYGWCYLGADGRMVTNKWVMDSKGWCYIGEYGYCLTSMWVKDSVGWCYLGADGRMVTNKWVADSHGWCYLGSDGRMVTNKWVMDSKGWCYVGADGYCITDKWIQDSVGWCYVDVNGRLVTDDWVEDSKGWRYLDENGRVVYDTMVGDYYVDKDGYLVP